jgi:hypothetical protein
LDKSLKKSRYQHQIHIGYELLLEDLQIYDYPLPKRTFEAVEQA